MTIPPRRHIYKDYIAFLSTSVMISKTDKSSMGTHTADTVPLCGSHCISTRLVFSIFVKVDDDTYEALLQDRCIISII